MTYSQFVAIFKRHRVLPADYRPLAKWLVNRELNEQSKFCERLACGQYDRCLEAVAIKRLVIKPAVRNRLRARLACA